ncbi:MAG: hypothetical protein K0Q52_74 [Microbacterium sp.]|jgi:hypothetical protein|nr:hypothetical protein [Microbacterium sp.]
MTDQPDIGSEEVERLLAEQLGFDPFDRHTPSDIIGGDTINWRTLTSADAAAVWEALREWVEWFTTRYSVPVSTVPDCWWQHGQLVEELSALHAAHNAAFDPSDTGFGPIGWHERLSIALPRLSRAYGGGCTNGHRPTKPRTWDDVTDETAWTAWTRQAHAHPSTASAHTQKEGQNP